MNNQKTISLKENKYLLLAFLFAFLNILVIYCFFGFQMMGDSRGYIETIHWFQGEENAEKYLHRILRPLGPALAVPFEFLGIGAGMIIQNIIFYLFSAYFVFRITEIIFNDQQQALLSVVFFITALPMLEAGLAYLTDTGAWFFYLLSLYLTLLYFKSKDENLILINGFLSGLGVLMKENAGWGILFFSLMVLTHEGFELKEKIGKIFLFGLFFLIPIIIFEFLIYVLFQYSHFKWFMYVKDYYFDVEGGKLSYILAHLSGLYRSLGVVGWPLFFVGLWQELKKSNIERKRIYLSLLPSSLSFVAWPASDARIVFIFAPLGILFVTKGLIFIEERIKGGKIFIFILVLMSIVVNYYFHAIGDYFPFIEIEDIIRPIL